MKTWDVYKWTRSSRHGEMGTCEWLGVIRSRHHPAALMAAAKRWPEWGQMSLPDYPSGRIIVRPEGQPPPCRVTKYAQENQGAGELVLAEVVLYGLVLGTLGIVGYALYNAIKNATAPGAAQSVAAGAGVAELGPGGSQQTIGAAAGTLGPAASVQAPAGSLEQPETS